MTNKLLSHVALKSSGPKLYWPNVILAGARNERFYRLFDRDLDVDRTLPLSAREWATYRSFRSDNQLPSSACPQFLLEILGLRSRPSIYDLLIHPCAGAKNRLWSVEKYQALLVALPASWRIAFLALPEEISNLGNVLSSDRQVNFIPIQVSLRSSLEALFSARLLLVMNSGTMYFADVLGIPTVAIFGQQNPTNVIDQGVFQTLYRHTVLCQPCDRNSCSQPKIYCLDNLDPDVVSSCLTTRFNSLFSAQPASAALTQIQNC